MNKKTTITLVALTFLLSAFSVVRAAAGRVDAAYVYKEYSLVKDAYTTVNNAQATVQRLIATAEQELTDLRAQGKPETEITQKQAEIQLIVDKSIQDLYKQKEDYDKQIADNFDLALKQIAQEKKLDVIYDSAFVSSGAIDLTQQLLQKLEKMKK